MAAAVAWTDPLLFFRRTVQRSQPFFALEREGNFSRYVYTGLIRNLDYETLWIGPSYVAPFGRGADPQSELVVSMGNMSGWEMTEILRLERFQGKAKVVNVLVSEQHLTDVFAPGWSNTLVFPSELWGRAGEVHYLFDPYMLRLAGRYLDRADPRRIQLDSPDMRRSINEAYFWMRDEPQALRDYWKQYNMRNITSRELARARNNLRRLTEAPAPAVALSVSEENMLAGLFAELRLVGRHAKVNLIVPPQHVSGFGTDYERLLHHREIKRRVVEQARLERWSVFDFQGDESCLDRTRFYDSGHFSERGVSEMREEIAGGVPRERSVPALFARFLENGEEGDQGMLAEMPD